jgi:hypothetical protein
MKKFLLAAVAMIGAFGNGAMADMPAVPQKFQGAWVCATGPMTIGRNAVRFGRSGEIRLSSIVAGDEGLTAIVVQWAPGHASPVEITWKLITLNRQQFLMHMNNEGPASSDLCRRR